MGTGSRGARRLPASPGASAVPTLEAHPPSHTYGTRTALLPNGHCSTRTTKDKIKAGTRGSTVLPVPVLQTGDVTEGTTRRSQLLVGGTGRALVTQRPPGCPELVLEPGADFILGCQKINPKWRETKERATSTPAQHPNRGPKAKSSHETKAKVQRKKESRSLTGWSVFRASAGRRDGGASKQTGPGLSLFVVITFCTSSRRSIMSQAGRSPLSVLPSLCPSVCLPVPGARENLLG